MIFNSISLAIVKCEFDIQVNTHNNGLCSLSATDDMLIIEASYIGKFVHTLLACDNLSVLTCYTSYLYLRDHHTYHLYHSTFSIFSFPFQSCSVVFHDNLYFVLFSMSFVIKRCILLTEVLL